MSAGGTPANVTLGPGRLYYAPLGTAEPVSASATLPAAWKAIGYTEEGSSVSTTITAEDIFVAEELDPVRRSKTQRTTSLSLAMAEPTVSRLALAVGADPTVTDDGTAYEFPDASADPGFMLVWDSAELPTDPLNRRWVFRQCSTSGTIEIARRKAPTKTTIPVTFDAVKPAAGGSPVKIFPDATGRI
jgi:hypothetical protein